MDYSLPGSSCPWNFSGKDIGMVCHFPSLEDLLNPVMESAPASLASTALAGRLFTTSATWDGLHACVLSHFSSGRLFMIPWTVAHQAPLSMGFSGKNTRVGCHDLLQGIFLTQGSKPGLLWLLRCRRILYH